jgi:hypothetical protein
VRFYGDKEKADAVYKGVDPLTPDDIAEVIVFAAGRRENVVIADTLIFPNHQVCLLFGGGGVDGDSADNDTGISNGYAQKKYIAAMRKTNDQAFNSHFSAGAGGTA